jgi:hypothetical protein
MAKTHFATNMHLKMKEKNAKQLLWVPAGRGRGSRGGEGGQI